ncbi:MAG: amidase, partial [Wenzhouxiangellaceae bacterium]
MSKLRRARWPGLAEAGISSGPLLNAMEIRIMNRHNAFCLLASAMLVIAFSARAELPDPNTAGITELHQAMRAGTLSAAVLVERHLMRIEQLDDDLRAVIAVDPTAREQARALDSRMAAGDWAGPLHGIPVLLKDNIETRDQPTTAGSLALAENDTGRDAPLVARLREAGAIILGKANLSEWANFRSTRSSSGWSAVGGQARNPYDPARSPCGSSSGSAVAVAAGMTVLALGTETNGSVVCPASANGVVGIKPTVGLVSRTHIVPISHNQDTAGPMGRHVRDAVLGLAAMAGPDQADALTAHRPEWSADHLIAHVRTDGLQGKRVGVLRSSAGFHSEVDALLEAAVAAMREAGAEVVDDVRWETPEGFFGHAYDVLLYEFKHDLNAYLAGLPDSELSGLTLEKLIEFNRENADRQMPWFGQEIFEQSQAKGPLTDEEYLEALENVQTATRAKGIDKLLAEHELDALIAPTGSAAWTIDLINGDHFIGGSSSLAAISGYPNITLPMGRIHGMPVGLSIFGAKFSEPVLIEIASGFEHAGGGFV